jgi:monovalent cation:H+ antiporter, CPA1 family
MTLAGTVLEISLLLLLLVVVALLTRRRSLPLSAVLVVVGLLIATAGGSPAVGELEGETFEQVVVFLLLPALVFSAALDLDLRAFLRDLPSVLALALVAFVVSAVLVGLTVHVALSVPLVVALLFGALISATDPVAVVAVFRELGVPRRLLVLVEGESLLNDGAAIVLSSVLLAAALGATTTPVAGVLEFLAVFFGGALIGAALGAVAALAMPWLDPLPAVALSLAVAYGGFVVAEEVLGFSGVMASAVAGLVLSGLAPSRASAAVRKAWEHTWATLDYLANGLLFLLIGLALGLAGLVDHAGAIALAVLAVLVSRAFAVVPVVWLMERFARVPRVGRRNEAVLVWGGLRGGVALAIALALPGDLADRELLVAMTGGVVLATLLLNATTIGALVHRLGLDRPTAADRFLAAAAKVASLQAAQQRLVEMGLDGDGSLAHHRAAAEDELRRLELGEADELRVVIGRGLQVERTTYQALSDARLLPAPVTRKLLAEVDDEVDELALLGPSHRLGTGRRDRHRMTEALRWVDERLPGPMGEDPEELAFADATARRLAARRTAEALDLFDDLPSVRPTTVQQARDVFRRWEQRAVDRLATLDERDRGTTQRLRERQASVLAEAEAARALHELASAGLLPQRLAEPGSG